jgi:putative hydroxymethylpyrimidine transport system permease protein
MIRLRYPFYATLIGLGLWQVVIWITGAPHFILPSPWRVATAGFENRALIAEHALVTATEVILGLLIGATLGALTAIQLAASPKLARMTMPLLVFTQAVPVFALAPILTLWFGYGMASKVVMAVLIIYFPVTSSFYDGLMRVTPALLDLAKTMGASEAQIMARIKVPHALPSLASGLKLAAVYAPIGAVIGEWVGSSQGLGYLMLLANGRAKIDLMFASLFALAMLTVALHRLISVLANRMNLISQNE